MSALVDIGSIRNQASAWIADNLDPAMPLHEWLSRLADSGWAAPHWPAECSGKGLPKDAAAAAFEEFRRHQTPGPTGLAPALAAPTIIAHGTDAQKQRYLRPILVGDEAWCQLFSEPGAGSDLAGVQTRALRNGSGFVINGQKVWTSGGLNADLGMLLARTDADVPKHRGITFFILDMDQPGVEVRPLRQMTGDLHFAEVFFTDARVPAENIVGELNGGWSVARTTLANERAALGASRRFAFSVAVPEGRRMRRHRETSVGEFVSRVRNTPPRMRGAMTITPIPINELLRLARNRGREHDPHVRQQLARLYTITQLNKWNNLRARAAAETSGRPGAEASLSKLMASQILRLSRDVGLEIAGSHGVLAGNGGLMNGALEWQFLSSPAPSIYGGSDEIQHNIIGERELGLPKEPDASKDVPFRELRVGTQSTVVE